MKSQVIQSQDQFTMLKDMLIQDAQIGGSDAFFDESEPESYPCIVQYHEMEGSTYGIELEEELDDEEIEERLDEMVEDEGNFKSAYIYDFNFIELDKIVELLEVGGIIVDKK